MNRLESRAEVLKLARVLQTSEDKVAFLERVDPADLRRLREQVTDTMFDTNLAVLQRLATASRLLPAPVLAKIAERVFGPLLCARIAGLIEVSRGVDVAKRLSSRFLADVAAELDPRRASEIIARIPARTVAEVARELARREDWITLGRFVGHVPDGTLKAALGEIDDAALLRVAFVLDDKARVGHVVRLLPRDRLSGLIDAAVERELWPAALDLVAHVDEPTRATIADLVADKGDDALTDLVDTARAQQLWDALVPLAAAMSDDARSRFATLLGRLPGATQGEIARWLAGDERLTPLRDAVEKETR